MTLLAAVFAAVAAATAVHLPVSTNNAQAQAAFDRGLFLYYAYDGSDAAAAFEEAARLDPRLAMARWGIALADGPDLNTPIVEARFDEAAAAAKKALSLESGASELERGFIEAMAARFRGKYADWPSRDAAYRAAMLALARDSRDENARLVAAEALLEGGGLSWHNGALANEESRAAAELVSAVLESDAASVMGNHLCIHLYDLAADRTPALPCAQRLDAANFPPQAEHLAHMPAHYWIEVGNYAAAVDSSERAYALLAQLDGGLDSAHAQHYAKHDVAVGYSAAMMLGNYEVARRWSLRMSATFGIGFDALTNLRFGRYADAYASDGNEFGGAAVRGLAALHMGRNADARALVARIPANSFAHGYIPQIFLAELAQAEKKYAESDAWIAKSERSQRDDFGGELIPLLPVGEAYGNLLLQRGNTTGAIAAFSQALATYPNDPRALFGLADALTAVKDGQQARAVRSRFQNEWKGADTEVRDALL